MVIIDNIENTWLNINSISGFSTGTYLSILNLTSTGLRFKRSGTQPNTEATDYFSSDNKSSPYSEVFSPAGVDEDLWVRSDILSIRGKILVQKGLTSISGQLNSVDPRIYTGLQGFTTQSFVEANVKNGTQFSLTDEILIPAATTIYRVFKTPTTLDTLIKTRLINTNGGMKFTQRVGADFTSGAIIDPVGAPLGSGLLFNLNDRVSNLPQSEYRDIGTLTSAGYPRDLIRSTEGQGSNREQGIFSAAGIERSLSRGTEYLFSFENLENKEIYVIFSTTWYEGPSSTDL